MEGNISKGGGMSKIQSNPEMIYRMLGSTGETVSAIGVGGWHLGLERVDEKLSIPHESGTKQMGFFQQPVRQGDGCSLPSDSEVLPRGQ